MRRLAMLLALAALPALLGCVARWSARDDLKAATALYKQVAVEEKQLDKILQQLFVSHRRDLLPYGCNLLQQHRASRRTIADARESILTITDHWIDRHLHPKRVKDMKALMKRLRFSNSQIYALCKI